MKPHFTVDFLVPLTVNIDAETREVTDVNLNLDGFQHGTTDTYRVFTGCADDETLDEYLNQDHPVAKEMLEIADRVLLESINDLPFTLRETA